MDNNAKDFWQIAQRDDFDVYDTIHAASLQGRTSCYFKNYPFNQETHLIRELEAKGFEVEDAEFGIRISWAYK